MRSRFALLFGLLVLMSGEARAQSCSFAVSDVDFGTVDILSGGAVDTTATLSITCSGLPLNTVRVCASIGAGSGGATATVRRLQGPTTTIDYQLYQDGGRTVVWGSSYWGLPGTPPTIDIPLNLAGNGSGNATIFARLLAAQQTKPAETYDSSFTAADNVFDYGYTFIGIVGCNLIPLLPQVDSATFEATATVDDNCNVTAADIDFGSVGILSANVDAQGEVSVTCTNGTPYSIALDGGLAAAPPTAREMSLAANTVTYGIYKDTVRTQPWGDGVGTLLASTGSGVAQPWPTYGRVPPQATPPPGAYSDSIIVTVSY